MVVYSFFSVEIKELCVFRYFCEFVAKIFHGLCYCIGRVYKSELRRKCIQYVDGHLTKPVQFNALRYSIRKLLNELPT